MKKEWISIVFVLAASTFLGSPRAEASELAVLGIYEQLQPTLNNSISETSFSPGGGFGAGLQFSVPLYGRFGLELGVSYSMRAWTDGSGPQLLPTYDFPAALRFRILRFWVLEAGGYYSSINAGSRVGYIGLTDFGVIAGTQVIVPVYRGFELLLGARYLYGLANVSLSGEALEFRGFEALTGIQLNLSK